MSSSRSWSWVAVSLLAAGCVAYRRAPIDVVSLSHSAPGVPAGPIAYLDAVRFAFAHNPDLLALRARASAINRSSFLEEISGSDSSGIAIDVIGLLRIGESGTQRSLAEAQFNEAVLRHHERAWEVAGEIAAAYEVERALAGLALPDVALPAESYVRAGIAPESAQSASESNLLRLRAEGEARAAARRENRFELLRLLGARPDAEIAIATTPLVLPEPGADPTWESLLRGRPDLRREMATYRVADQELRRAVAEQYPHLTFELPALDGAWEPLDALGLTAPLRAPSEARAKIRAREAARLEAKAAVLTAMRDVAQARSEAASAALAVDAARRRTAADAALLRTARARLETESGSFLEAVFASEAAVDSAVDLREAVVADARARVRRAHAAGWPALPEVDCPDAGCGRPR